jgi:hypothetical protein
MASNQGHCEPVLCSKPICKAYEKAIANIFKTLLLCNVCLAFPDGGRFLACERGHTICVPCHGKFSKSTNRFKCPVCREKSLVFENKSLAAIVDELMCLGRIECKNCDEKITPASYMRHLTYFCPDRDFQCPACKLGVRPSVFFDHFKICLKFNYIMPILMMRQDKVTVCKFTWDFGFLPDRLNCFCLIVASEHEYMYSKRELSRLPPHLWVNVYEEQDCLWLQVRLIKTYFSSETITPNFDEINPKEFTFKLRSGSSTQSFTFGASEKQQFKKALVTKDAYGPTFNISEMYELSFCLEMTLW